ncbi:MAG: sugar phosphate isomerase/epimerase [Clostridia bacterium]|nr:sugar phosphate isomerase/epimerase [Clostridia bacterium]
MIKTGIDSYCYHRFFGVVYPGQEKPAQRMSLNDFMQEAARLGAKGISLHASFLERLEEPYMREVAGEIEGFGFDAVYAWTGPGDLEGLAGGPHADAFAQLMRDIPLAHLLGAKVVRVTSAGYASRQPREAGEMMAPLVEGFKAAAAVAKDYGMQLAFENQAAFTPQQLLQMTEQVDSEHFGLCLDTGNFVRQLVDPLDAIDLLGLHARVVLLKPVALNSGEAGISDWYFFGGVPAGQGLSDDQAAFDLLERAGYQGLVLYSLDHPQSGWYGREKEVCMMSMHQIEKMARIASR